VGMALHAYLENSVGWAWPTTSLHYQLRPWWAVPTLHTMKKFFSLLCTGLLLTIIQATGYAGAPYYAPPPAPPVMHKPEPQIQAKKGLQKIGGMTEWTYHKSADGSHPDGTEQQLMWLMNRARSNPTAEGVWLATKSDPDVEGG